MFPRGSLPLSGDITPSSATCLASSPWEATLRHVGRTVSCGNVPYQPTAYQPQTQPSTSASPPRCESEP